MGKEEEAWLDFRARVFKALGDATRLRILHFLKNGERCVCEVFPYVDLAQPTVSRHLKVLKQCGILKVRKEGNKRLYSVTDPRIYEVLGALDEDFMWSLSQRVLKRWVPLAKEIVG
jgi:ArsR family transcriptional regulator